MGYHIYFDMINKCNLSCPSCYRGIYGNTEETMSLETLEQALEHIFAHFSPVDVICPYNWSEPFLCKNIGAYIALLSRYKPAGIYLSTNGNILPSTDLLTQIVPHISLIRFSVSGADQDVYERYHRGGKISRTWEAIDRFVQIKDLLGCGIQYELLFGRNLYNRGEEEKLAEYCKQKQMAFIPYDYTLNCAELAYEVLLGNHVDAQTYNLLYDSYEALREKVLSSLTPNRCPVIDEHITLDHTGCLTLCCAASISTGVPVTEIKSKEELKQVRLGNSFCRNCYEAGLSGLFFQWADKNN